MAYSKGAEEALRYLAGCPAYGHTTLSKQDTQNLLLESGGTLLAQGSLYNIKTQDLGADVFKISCKLAWNEREGTST